MGAVEIRVQKYVRADEIKPGYTSTPVAREWAGAVIQMGRGSMRVGGSCFVAGQAQ